MTYLKGLFGVLLACYAVYGIRSVVTPPVVVTQTVTQCCPAPKPKPIGSKEEVAVVSLVNQERVKRGLHPLKVSEKLMVASQDWSRNQAARKRMYHSRNGYGENVAYGQDTPSEVMQAWMRSRGHRNNILSSRYQYMGAGYAVSRNGQPYWTQSFF